MAFIVYLISGFFAGILGGMGMGGGTILIPALTIFAGVDQKVAQATNLLAFLPMAACVLPSHARRGLLKTDDAAYIVPPALVTTVLSSILMAALPVIVLKKLFGYFLIGLALREVVNLAKSAGERA